MKLSKRFVRGIAAGVAVLGIVAASLVVTEAAYAADAVSLAETTGTNPTTSGTAVTYTVTVSCSTTGGCVNSTLTIPTTQITGDGSVSDISSWITNSTCPTMTKPTGLVSFAYGTIPTGTQTCTFTVKAPDKTTLNGAAATLTPTFTDAAGSATGAATTLNLTATGNAALTDATSGSAFTGGPMTLTFTMTCGAIGNAGDLGLTALSITDALPSNFTFSSMTTAPATLTGTKSVPAAGTSGGTISYSGNGSDCNSPANDRIVFTVTGTATATTGGTGTPDPVGATVCHAPTSTFTYVDGTSASSNPAQKCANVVDINYLASKGVTAGTLGNLGQYKALDNTTTSRYTFPGDWDQTGGDTDFTLGETTSPAQANGGLSYAIADPLPCIDSVSGADYVGKTAGVACAHPAYVPKTVTVTGFVPTTSDSINILFADGTTGSVAYVSGTGWTLPTSPAISELDFPAFPEEGANTATAILFTITGYATSTDVPGHILHNVATTTGYFSGTSTTVKVPQARSADVLVADPASPSGTVVYPSLTVLNSTTQTCVENVAFNSGTNAALHNRIEIAHGPSSAIYLDYLSPANAGPFTGTTINFSLVGPSGHTYSANGITATQTSNYNGTGRTLLEWVIPAGTVTIPGLYLINAAGFTVGLPAGCAGTYPNAITVGYGDAIKGCTWDNYVSSSGQAPPMLPPGDTTLDSNGSPITGNFCGYSAPLTTPKTTAGFVVDKTVQGNLDSAPVSAGGVGKVTPTDGSATYDVSFTNTGKSNLHDPVMYDILPRVGDTEAWSTTQRDSQFAVQLADIGPLATGVSIEYSQTPNPCRPEVLANASNPGCIDDWSSTPPSPLSNTTALRIAYSGTIGVNGSPFIQSFDVTYSVNTPVLPVGAEAWNSVGSNAHLGETGDDNPTDDPFIGASESSYTGLTASTDSPQIAKSASLSTYDTVGQTVHFDFDVTNNEEVPLTGVGVVDSFTDAPGGETPGDVTCSILSNPDAACSGATTSLAPGQVAHFTASYVITQDDLDHGQLSDSAVVTADASGASLSNTSNVVTLHADVTNGLSLVKSSSTPSYSAVGDEVDYSFLVTNTGTQTLHGIEVDDPSIATVDCPATTLAPGVSTTCTGSYNATQSDIDTGSIVNTATASGVAPDSTSVTSDESSATVDATQHGELTLTKTATPSSVAAVGDGVTFHFTVANTGNLTLLNVAIDEGTFTGTGTLSTPSCPQSTLDVGDSMDCTATYSATQADLDAGSISNTATATGKSSGGDTLTSEPSTATVSVQSDAALKLTKTADVTTITTVGQTVNYSFEIQNTGNVTVTNVIVQEGHFTGTGTLSAIDCPTGVASMAPGDDVTCTASYTVTAADLRSGTLSNTATATGSDGVTTIASADSTAAVTSDPADSGDPTVPPVLGYTGVSIGGGILLAAILVGVGGVALLLRRRRREV